MHYRSNNAMRGSDPGSGQVPPAQAVVEIYMYSRTRILPVHERSVTALILLLVRATRLRNNPVSIYTCN